MPAGTDLITWNPRVGATSDDRYDIAADTPIKNGTYAYSDPPTIDEVNSGTGINQIIAEINRRAGENEVLIEDNYYSQSYVGNGAKIAVQNFTTLIDAARVNAEQSAYSWPTTPVAGNVVDQNWFFHMRKALAIDHIPVYLNLSDHTVISGFQEKLAFYIDAQNNFYPPTTRTVAANNLYIKVGQDFASPRYYEWRGYLFFRIPSSIPTLGDAKLSVVWLEDQSDTNFTLDFYRSNSHLPPFTTADWGNLDNLEGSIAASGISVGSRSEIDVDHTAISGGSGTTYIIVSDREVADTTPAGEEWITIQTHNDSPPLTDPQSVPILKLYTA
jgi:hypothetical protein